MEVVYFLGFAYLVFVLVKGRKQGKRFQQELERLEGRIDFLVREMARRDAKPEAAPVVVPVILSPIPPPIIVETSPEPELEQEPEPPPTPRPSTPPPPPPTPADRARKWLDIEEMLGTNWLNKLGVMILVIGIALFLAFELREVGPGGKILVGMLVSAAMLGAGVWFERNERWRIIARAGIAGGWALFFFTTYAMYHVPAARVLQSQATDLMLLFIVGVAMVAHSLRYQSQVTTGIAFLLAFSTITISQVNVYSLAADGILAAGIAMIAWRFAWYELEVFGILAAYLNHWYWVSHIIEPMHGHKYPFPEFLPSAALLIFYWAVFRASYVLRRIPPMSMEHQGEKVPPETVSTIAALLNSFLLLTILKYQAVHPEWAFYALLALGAAELALGQVTRIRERRVAFVILSTIGATLMMSAIPFRYSGARMSAIWLFEAEALFLAGVYTQEVLFRYLGMLGGAATVIQMISFDAAAVMGRRWDDADNSADFRTGLLFVLGSAVFYANSLWLPRRKPDVFRGEYEDALLRAVCHTGAILLWIFAWMVCPEQWTVAAWSAAALAIAILGKRLDIEELTIQGNVIAVATLLRLLPVNFEMPAHRWLSVGIVVVFLCAMSRWSGLGKTSQLYTWAATLTLMHLAWLELASAAVVLAWIIVALALTECGFAMRSWSLRLQSVLAFAAAFARLFFVNLNAVPEPGELSPIVYTLGPAALAFWYAYWRWEDGTEFDQQFQFQRILGFLGTITLVALVRFEIAADWVAAAWAVMLVALIWVAQYLGRRYFLHQALLLAVLVFFRAGFYNLYERTYFPTTWWQSRWICVGLALALLGIALWMAYSMRIREAPEGGGRFVRVFGAISRRPEQLLFFLTLILLTALLESEASRGMVTLVWGGEAVAVFVFALWVRERSFRLAGLGLLLLAVGKIVFFDVWRLGARDRYLTFIALGSALLAVSWLYTRYRETVRQYL